MEGFDCSKIFTSEEVLAGDEFVFTMHCSSCLEVRYRLTDTEWAWAWAWASAMRGKYSIIDFIDRNTVDGVLTADIMNMSRALDDDCFGVGKAVNLSDDTALQKLFFLCYREDYDGRDNNEI